MIARPAARSLCAAALSVAVLLASGAPSAVQAGSAPAAGHAPDRHTLFVRPPDVGCGSLPGCFTSIQQAIDAAQSGDEIWVAEGRYTEVLPGPWGSQIGYINKSLTLRGGYDLDFTTWDPDTHITTLDAQGAGRALTINGDHTEHIIEGFEVTGGNDGGIFAMLGLSCDLTFRHNNVHHNTSDHSGGMFVDSGRRVTIEDNIFANNTAAYSGGGMFIFNSREVVLRNNLWRRNQASSGGGAIRLSSVTDTQIVNDLIVDNRCQRGAGGVHLESSRVDFLHTTLADNGKTAIHAPIPWPSYSTRMMFYNTILSGHKFGLLIEAGNEARFESTLWSNSVDYTGAGNVSIGTRNLWANPRFVGQGDYHLRPDSPAIDFGMDAGIENDFDGDVRPFGPAPDLGADEFTG